MATCKDCIHYDACKDIFLQLGKKEEVKYMDDNGVHGAENECKQFKDKSRFLELKFSVEDIKNKITCREKLAKEHPDEIDGGYLGGCTGCPFDHGYAKRPIFCKGGSDPECTYCWSMEAEEDSDENTD